CKRKTLFHQSMECFPALERVENTTYRPLPLSGIPNTRKSRLEQHRCRPAKFRFPHPRSIPNQKSSHRKGHQLSFRLHLPKQAPFQLENSCCDVWVNWSKRTKRYLQLRKYARLTRAIYRTFPQIRLHKPYPDFQRISTQTS